MRPQYKPIATLTSVARRNRRNRNRGKRYEKVVAEFWGGKRVGILGSLDVDHTLFGIETKVRAKLPATIKSWYAQAVNNAGPRVPLVQLHEFGTRFEEDLCIIKATDLREIVNANL